MARTPSDAARIIGEHIAAARKKQSLSVDELAVKAKIDSSNIRGFESGRAMLSVKTLCRIVISQDIGDSSASEDR